MTAPVPGPAALPRRRSRLPGFLAGALSTALVGAAALTGWFYYSYDAWPGLGIGDRISWCGHDYRLAVTDLSAAEANTDPEHSLAPAFRYPPMWSQEQVYAALGSAVPRTDDPTPPCLPTLYVQTGPDRYTSYVAAG